MQFLLFPPSALKYTDAMCVASGTCWTEDVTSTDHVQTSEKLCLSLQGQYLRNLGVPSVVLIETAVFSDTTPCRFVCRYWHLQEACWLHLQGSPRKVTTTDCLQDGDSQLLQNLCSCMPVHTVTPKKSGMFDTKFCAKRIIITWWQMTTFFRVTPRDASNSSSHYLVNDISTWLDECNEIKGHGTNVDVYIKLWQSWLVYSFHECQFNVQHIIYLVKNSFTIKDKWQSVAKTPYYWLFMWNSYNMLDLSFLQPFCLGFRPSGIWHNVTVFVFSKT